MATRSRNYILAIVTSVGFTLLLWGFLGCNKTSTNNNPLVAMGTLIFHIHTFIDTAEVLDTSKAYANSDGRMMKIRLAQLYISNIRLVKSDGTIFRPDSVILKNIANEDYPLGPIPAGTYPSVMFDVGIDTPTNHKNPSSYASTEYLSLQNPSMWF